MPSTMVRPAVCCFWGSTPAMKASAACIGPADQCVPQRKRSSFPAPILCRPQEGLKAAVWHAPAGTGDVERIITGAPFKPGARGFTSLLQLVSRDRSPKAWQKAMEVRQAMRDRPDLHPNTITYSVSLAAQKSQQSWQGNQRSPCCKDNVSTCQPGMYKGLSLLLRRL